MVKIPMSDNCNTAPVLNTNGVQVKGEDESAMSEGELSSDGEDKSIKAASSRPSGTVKVEKCSADFFDSSSGNRSEGEVSDSEMEPGAIPSLGGKKSDSKFSEQDNPWTQAAMGIYPSLPFAKEGEGEEWGEENVKAWSEYYSRAMEHMKLGRRKRYRRMKLKVPGLHPRKRTKNNPRGESESSLKDAQEMEMKEMPENTTDLQPASSPRQESDESSDFEFEGKEEPVSLSDVIAHKEQMDLAVLAGENADNLKRNAKEVMFGRGKKRKKNRKNKGGKASSNNIRRESKREYWSNDTFRSTVMQPQFCTESAVCMYWKMYGYCNKGDACNYSHLPQFKGVAPPTKRIPDVCKFYLQDTCQKGSNCNYYHEEFPCKYFHKGLTCYQGDNCKFSHAPLNEETMKLLEKAWALVKGRPLTAGGQRENEQNFDTPLSHLYSAAPQEEQKIRPAHFALSSPPPMGYPPQSEMDPTPRHPTHPPHQRYPFPPQGVRPGFNPIKSDPRPRSIPMSRHFGYRTPHPQFISHFPRAPQYLRGPPPNRYPLPHPPPRLPPDTSAIPRDPTPPAYQPINYESDEPGQPPISPLSFLSDDIEEKALTIDAGPVGSPPNESPSPLISPNSGDIPFFSDHSSHSLSSNQIRPVLSRSDSTQSDPRLCKGSRAKKGSLSDAQGLLNRSHSAEGLRSPEFLHSDPRVELQRDSSPLPSPDPVPILPDNLELPVPVKPKTELQFEMPLPLRDPGILTKPMDPRVLFQNAREKAKLVGLSVKREVVETVETL